MSFIVETEASIRRHGEFHLVVEKFTWYHFCFCFDTKVSIEDSSNESHSLVDRNRGVGFAAVIRSAYPDLLISHPLSFHSFRSATNILALLSFLNIIRVKQVCMSGCSDLPKCSHIGGFPWVVACGVAGCKSLKLGVF